MYVFIYIITGTTLLYTFNKWWSRKIGRSASLWFLWHAHLPSTKNFYNPDVRVPVVHSPLRHFYDLSTRWPWSRVSFPIWSIAAANSCGRNGSPSDLRRRQLPNYSIWRQWKLKVDMRPTLPNGRPDTGNCQTTVYDLTENWKVVMMPNSSSLAAPEIVVTTTSGVASGDKVDIIAALGFSCRHHVRDFNLALPCFGNIINSKRFL